MTESEPETDLELAKHDHQLDSRANLAYPKAEESDKYLQIIKSVPSFGKIG